jgi:hypothetical protein
MHGARERCRWIEREGEREREREGGRDGGRDGGREGERERGGEGEREREPAGRRRLTRARTQVIAAHPLESLFVSGGRDASVRLWRPSAAPCLGVYTLHRHRGPPHRRPLRRVAAGGGGLTGRNGECSGTRSTRLTCSRCGTGPFPRTRTHTCGTWRCARSRRGTATCTSFRSAPAKAGPRRALLRSAYSPHGAQPSPVL